MKVKTPTSSNVSYSIFNDNEYKIADFKNCTCFGNLYNSTRWHTYSEKPQEQLNRPVKFLVVSIRDNPFSEEKDITPMWAEYLAQVSPFRSAFFSECLPHVNSTKNLVIDLEQPCNLVSCSAISTRFSYEASHTTNGKKGVMWYELVKAGMDPNLAYMVALSTTINGDRAEKVSGITTAIGHSFTRCLGDKFVANFLTDAKSESVDKFSDIKFYKDTYKLFGESNRDVYNFNNILQSIFNKKIGEEKKQEYTNPFASRPSHGDYKDLKAFADQLVTELKGFNVNEFFDIKEKKSVAA